MPDCDVDGGGNFMHLIWTIVTRTSSDDLVMHSLHEILAEPTTGQFRGKCWTVHKESILNHGNNNLLSCI